MGGRGASLNNTIGRPNDATEWYVSGEGMWINQYLRGRGDFGELSQFEKQMLADLDRATNGNIKDKTLYRNVTAEAIFNGYDSETISNLFRVLQYGDNAFGRGAYAENLVKNVRNMIQNTKGKTITEKGFMSTTTDRTVAENWGDFTGSSYPIVMEIKTSKNTKGVDLSSYDRNVSQEEAQHEKLLARGQKYTVKDVGIKNGNVYVYVEMK